MYKLIFFLGLLLPGYLKAQIADSSRREIKLQGAANFRDLGGYATTDGHHLRWGYVYRSADISKLTDNDLALLKDRHIDHVVDLRGVQESRQAPDRLNPGTDYILCPAGSDSINAKFFQHLPATKQGGDSLMTAFYANTTYLTARYKPFFNKLMTLPAGDALLFHCTAGKDRTGIAAALLLYALGVSYETIRQDYEATNYYRAKENEKMIRAMTAGTAISEPVAKALMSANGAWLDATFAAIRMQYGSIDRYLSDELGLDQEKLLRLKAIYLE